MKPRRMTDGLVARYPHLRKSLGLPPLPEAPPPPAPEKPAAAPAKQKEARTVPVTPEEQEELREATRTGNPPGGRRGR